MLQWSRENSPSNESPSGSGVPAIWKIAAQFFVAKTDNAMDIDDYPPQNMALVEAFLNPQQLTPLAMSATALGVDTEHNTDGLAQQDNRDENTQDEPDEHEDAGLSDKEGNGEAVDNQKNQR
jgi:hypothetical protein